MFTTLAFAPLVALYAAQAAYGIVTPTGPDSSDVFKAGSTCLTTWKGDMDSPSPWKSMDIELMSGDNINMVHVTTVATNQDGSVDGQFSFPCPEVDPFSAIYFYQYSTTAVSNKTWTTRFTIASDSGDTTPPASSVQPNGAAPTPWGVGKLVDQSKVVPPPPSAGGTVDTNAGSSSGSAAASTTSSSVAVAGTTAAATTVGETSAAASSSSGTSSRFVTSTTGSAGALSTGTSTASAASANGTTSTQDSSAVVHAAGGWKVAGVTAAFAMAFAILL